MTNGPEDGQELVPAKNKVVPQNVTIEELENKISVKVTKTIKDEKYITSTIHEL